MRRLRQRSGGAARSTLLAVTPLVLLAMAGVIGLVAAGTTYYVNASSDFREPVQVINERGGGARLYDRDGILLYEFLDEEYGIQERVTLEQISPWVLDATIAAEDASFYTNPGINIRGIARAASENLVPGEDFLAGSGGSSITQQLVKQLYFDAEERTERSIFRKVREAIIALELTRDYDKDQILEWYLNEIPYGGVFTGIEAASQGYFGIPASQLSLGQATFLAGLPQSPGEYDPFTKMDAARERQHDVIELMVKHGFLDRTAADWAKLEVITLAPKARPFNAPHFVLYVEDYLKATLGEDAVYRGGLEVMTTLDLELNLKANEVLEQYLDLYEDASGGHNGSVVITEPATGQILAMVGSRDYFRDDVDGRVNNAVALNSPGSTLKPFTYTTAFKMGWGPEWPIVDTSISYKAGDDKPFSPRNPDGRNRGIVTVKSSLGNSFNIPAFKAILFTGVDNMVATAKSMGITTLDRDLGPAITLGGIDVKLLDMVYGYGVFANNGIMAGAPTTLALPPGNRQLDPMPVLEVKKKNGEVVLDNRVPVVQSVLDAEYAWMISDILSRDENRAITYGRGSNLNIPGHTVAVKTGTSEPYDEQSRNRRLIGDTWTIGYTPDVAVGVWVGNSDNTPMVNILSTTIAGGTWHEVMELALAGKPRREFQRPPGIIEATVCVPSGRLPQQGQSCPSVTGLFAAQSLVRANDEGWWGGQELVSAYGMDNRGIPAEITDWKRYVAEEYVRIYRRSSGAVRSVPTPTAVPNSQAAPPAAQQPAPPGPPGGDGPGNGGRGNGNNPGRAGG
jgi:membrane peptidoglycan carboxypeptidase